ncbi:Panacea domain-containing protein [Roseateles sp. UC29_93]|uniref:Panacea domain-containing protein n=1 Tax=Roseateles sp. UC29_93 TaxID=3350177 RepID=UPI00367138F8
MPYSPAIVANAVLHRAKQRRIFVNHLKLQKLVFFTHAWSLALHDAPVVEERPEAWRYGPVFDSLFHRLRPQQGRPITAFLKTVDEGRNAYVTLMPAFEDEAFWDVLDQVMDRYGHLSADQLSALGHERGGAWEQTREAKQAVIPDDRLRQFYRGKLQ